MVRRERVFLDGGIYHVYSRITRGEFVFDDPEFAQAFVVAARKRIEIDGITVFAWCLMSNHYHLVVRTSHTALWRTMLRFHPEVTRYHNRRRRVYGSLWQSRYKARLVRDNEYFRQVVAYVHLNPVAAGLVNDPADWRWSGHAPLLGISPAVLVNPAEILKGFGETPVEGRERYLDCLRNVAEMRWTGTGVRDLPWWKRVRNNRQLVESEDVPQGATDWEGAPVLPELNPPRLTELLEMCSEAADCPVDQICGSTRTPQAAIARYSLARLAVDTFGYKVVEVARLLDKHPNSISRWRTTKPDDECLRICRRIKNALETRINAESSQAREC